MLRVGAHLFGREDGQEVGQEGAAAGEKAGGHDGQHGQYQAGGAGEAAAENEVEARAQEGREDEPQREGNKEWCRGELQQVKAEQAAARADRRLGEVQHPRGPVDEHDAGSDEPVEQAIDDTDEDNRERRAATAGRRGGDDAGHDQHRQ